MSPTNGCRRGTLAKAATADTRSAMASAAPMTAASRASNGALRGGSRWTWGSVAVMRVAPDGRYPRLADQGPAARPRWQSRLSRAAARREAPDLHGDGG